jgi:hypothetical protein
VEKWKTQKHEKKENLRFAQSLDKRRKILGSKIFSLPLSPSFGGKALQKALTKKTRSGTMKR